VVEVSTFVGGYAGPPVDVLGVPVSTHNDLVTKVVEKGVVVSGVDAVTWGTV